MGDTRILEGSDGEKDTRQAENILKIFLNYRWRKTSLENSRCGLELGASFVVEKIDYSNYFLIFLLFFVFDLICKCILLSGYS